MLFLTEHFSRAEHMMQITAAVKRQVWEPSIADFTFQFKMTCL